MDWSRVKYFKEKEFFGQGKLLDEQMIINIDVLRELLQERVYISPAEGAIARFTGRKTSQHYVGPSPDNIVRQGTALDVFIEGIPFLNFNEIVHSRLFSGIGVYVDTIGPNGEPWVMFHLDHRITHSVADPLIWVCVKGVEPGSKEVTNIYKYPQNNSADWQYLKKTIFFREQYM